MHSKILQNQSIDSKEGSPHGLDIECASTNGTNSDYNKSTTAEQEMSPEALEFEERHKKALGILKLKFPKKDKEARITRMKAKVLHNSKIEKIKREAENLAFKAHNLDIIPGIEDDNQKKQVLKRVKELLKTEISNINEDKVNACLMKCFNDTEKLFEKIRLNKKYYKNLLLYKQ
mmetsp:Transcript_22743/g.19776  ORF Transcript_22743/g.19776 Transcript_22743/m.19776 type:complete len:175 (-) Transcript_22743:216-740(-)